MSVLRGQTEGDKDVLDHASDALMDERYAIAHVAILYSCKQPYDMHSRAVLCSHAVQVKQNFSQ